MSTVLRPFFNTELPEILSVASLEPLGPASWQKLRQSFSSLDEILKAPKAKLVAAGLTPEQAEALRNRPLSTEVAERLMRSKSISLITLEDASYPAPLKEINDPPLWLFYRGSLSCLKEKTFTVVGTRKPSSYALQVVEKLLPDWLARELCVVSGLAYGIDKAAHQRSLEATGKTAAVLAGGLDSIYPTDNHHLAERIIEAGGVLISEYPPMAKPRPWKFPVRNRIVAGLSPASIIIEAKIKSGSLTTAKSALDYNRDVLAVPGDITRSSAEGTNFLLKHGAILIDSPEQIAELYGITAATAAKPVDKELVKILDLLSTDGLSPDQLVACTKQPIEKVLGNLLQLELENLVYQSEAGRYLRKS